MTVLPHSTTSLLSRSMTNLLALAGLILLFPTTADAMPVVGDPPPPPLPEDDAGGDDLFLLKAAVSPNVVLFLDNSDSMNEIEWHPAFDPDKVPDASYCTLSADITEFGGVLDPDHTYEDTQDRDNVNCNSPARGNRTVYFVQHPDSTYWSGRYLMWYLGLPDGDPILNEIDNAVANIDGCTQAGGSGDFADMYRRTRFEATKQVLLDLLCIAEPKNVRFGSAAFREAEDAGGVDPNGGFISEDLGRSNPNHAAQLEASIKGENPVDTDGTPLAETLFQIYTYWMPRVAADMPLGRNGNPFPIYEYDKAGVQVGSVQWFEDTMIYDCEKAFVIIVTDGSPTRDTFDLDVIPSDPATTALGFGDFGTGGAIGLIGDYHIEAGTAQDPIDVEEPGGPDEPSFYLDDISKYMFDKDFRPDLDGTQTIDTYVVGFATGDDWDNPTNKFLRKVAENGNGTFYTAKDGDELVFHLVDALNDIIEKAASFTAATVPSARTADGADFYQSYFFPRGKSAFWEGHIRAWKITADGEIHDADTPSKCALDDPMAPAECNSGQFLASAEYFWDASEEVPLPADRYLYVSKDTAVCGIEVLASGSLPPEFTQAEMCAEEFDLVPFAVPSDPLPNDPADYPVVGSTAINAEGLADELVEYLRGCFLGTGVTSADVSAPTVCQPRPARLGDVFHSNAIVIRQPHVRMNDEGYSEFKAWYAGRDRLLYAGTNGGFLEAFDTGEWKDPNPPDTPTHASYTRGEGTEIFGFMPWEVRRRIKVLPVDDPTSRNNYVDGDVNSADVWIDDDLPADLVGFNKAEDPNEWHTYLLGALREGGHHYYALDVTNPKVHSNAAPAPPLDTYGHDLISPPAPLNTTGLNFPGYGWEWPPEGLTGDLTTGDRAFMGETWSKPIITKVRLKDVIRPGDTVDRWVAIVTGGYDKDSDPNPVEVTGIANTYDQNAVRGRGIYIIDLRTGGVLAEKKFVTTVGPEPGMLHSIVSTPSVLDLDFDGAADVIYVGDMGGSVWKWVIHTPGEDRIWDGSGLRSQPVAQWPFKKFFQAAAPATVGGVDYYKNFMFPPAAAFKSGVLYIAFGSGERRNLTFGGDDSATGENNRFYVMIDADPYELQSLATITEANLTDFTASAAAQTFTNKGFYITTVDGEKFVTNVDIFNGDVIASTFIPTVSADPCATRGAGTLYIFDLQTGEGHFDDGSGGAQRWTSLGAGLPTDSKISCGPGGEDCVVITENSGAGVDVDDEDDIDLNGATLYWREND